MRQYLLRRLLLFLPTLLGTSLLIFILLRLVPGDIAEILVYEAGTEFSAVQSQQIQQIRQELGLDRPITVQFVHWLGNAVRGDLGYSYSERRPVVQILTERFPRSMELAFLTILIALLWAVPLGVIAAAWRGSWADSLVQAVSISGLSLPIFVTGILILYALVRIFRWLPPWSSLALWMTRCRT